MQYCLTVIVATVQMIHCHNVLSFVGTAGETRAAGEGVVEQQQPSISEVRI